MVYFFNSVETIQKNGGLRLPLRVYFWFHYPIPFSPMTIFNIYSDQLGEQQFGAIAQAIGSTRDQAIVGSSQIVPFLVSAMARNTRTDAGAKALSDMLDKDHNGSILMNLPALYANRTNGNGEALANGILGSHRGEVEAWVSQESGLNAASTAKLMNITTPILLGMIGMKKAQDKINAALLAQMLNNFAELHEREENPEAAAAEAPAEGGGFLGSIPGLSSLGNIGGLLKSGNFGGIGKMITGLLDKNKDGSVMDDIQGMVGGLMGGNK
jgi:Bacterial protein of unknown function (DUF937)